MKTVFRTTRTLKRIIVTFSKFRQTARVSVRLYVDRHVFTCDKLQGTDRTSPLTKTCVVIMSRVNEPIYKV